MVLSLLLSTPPRGPLRGKYNAPKEGKEGGVCVPRAFGPSGAPSFLARWRVWGRPAARGPAGIGSVGGVGEGAPLLLADLLAQNLPLPRVAH